MISQGNFCFLNISKLFSRSARSQRLDLSYHSTEHLVDPGTCAYKMSEDKSLQFSVSKGYKQNIRFFLRVGVNPQGQLLTLRILKVEVTGL